MLWGFYNHGVLFVKGAVHAYLIYEDDMEMHFGSFGNVTAIVGENIMLNSSLTHTDGKPIIIKGPVLATHKLSDIIFDKLIETENGIEKLRSDEPDGAIAYLLRGDTLIDFSKEAIYNYAFFGLEIETAFNRIFRYPEIAAKNYLEWREDDTKCCWTTRYEEEGKWYRKVGKIVFNNRRYAASVVYEEGTKDYVLELKFIDSTRDKEKYNYKFFINDGALEATAIKFCIRQAITYFLAIDKYRFNLYNFSNMMATPLMPDKNQYLKVIFLNFIATISKASVNHQGEHKCDNILLVNTDNFAWHITLKKDVDHDFLIVEYRTDIYDKKTHFNSLTDSENIDFHNNFKRVWLELMKFIDRKMNQDQSILMKE